MHLFAIPEAMRSPRCRKNHIIIYDLDKESVESFLFDRV